MSARIDHAAEARKHIDWAHEQQAVAGEFDESVQHNATLAVAEATLALVEQQRLANVIAFTVGSGYSASSAVLDEIAAGIGMPPAADGPF